MALWEAEGAASWGDSGSIEQLQNNVNIKVFPGIQKHSAAAAGI